MNIVVCVSSISVNKSLADRCLFIKTVRTLAWSKKFRRDKGSTKGNDEILTDWDYRRTKSVVNVVTDNVGSDHNRGSTIHKCEPKCDAWLSISNHTPPRRTATPIVDGVTSNVAILNVPQPSVNADTIRIFCYAVFVIQIETCKP